MNDTSLEITPMARSTNHLLNFYGPTTDTYILIAKAIIKGAEEYEQNEELKVYNPGTVLATRAEAICVQQQLYHCVQRSKEQSARIAGKRIISTQEIPALHNNHYNQSQILEELIRKLSGNSQEQRYTLGALGENVSIAQVNPPYTEANKVNIVALKERKASSTEKTLFREFNKIKTIVDRL